MKHETENVTPQTALKRLKEGNQRFVSGMRAVDPMLAHLKMADLAAQGQKPFAIVLTCSDSRSPVELIFDQGVGALFVVRVAGNVVAPSLLASIEFAAANFGSPLIIVLGHTHCGAVQATIDHMKHPEHALPSPHLEELVGRIRPGLEGISTPKNPIPDLREGTVSNIQRSMRLIRTQSEIVRNLESKQQLQIVGGLLDISNGIVGFFES